MLKRRLQEEAKEKKEGCEGRAKEICISLIDPYPFAND
jgi:hypothetical protein